MEMEVGVADRIVVDGLGLLIGAKRRIKMA